MCWKAAVKFTDIQSSIAVRLALLFAVVALVAFSLIALVLNLVMANELERHQYEQIQSRTDDMRYMLLHARAPGIAQRVKEKLDALSPPDGRVRYWMHSEDPAFQYGTELPAILQETTGKVGMVDLRIDGRHIRALRNELPATVARPAVTMVVGVDTRPFARTAHSFRVASLLITLVGVGLVAALGYWVARVGLAPVVRLSQDIRAIGPHNRAQRLQLPTLPLELAQLGASFNAALDRLEQAYLQLATFNDDVAHELRTPLGNMIGQTQVALSRERNPDQLKELLQSNLEELERLRLIVADMLFLARADQGERANRSTTVSIAQEVEKTIEFLEILFDDAGLTVQVVGDQMASIETALFRRALTNLLLNAIQYAQSGTRISADISTVGSQAHVAISNVGPPIAAAHIHRIFDRFYRVDSSRANFPEQPGHGLGLAIVKAVASMHGGTVFASSQDHKTTVGFTVDLQPSATSAASAA